MFSHKSNLQREKKGQLIRLLFLRGKVKEFKSNVGVKGKGIEKGNEIG